MKNCMTCNAECESSAIICLECGSIADQPVIENTIIEAGGPEGKVSIPEANLDRQKFNLLSLKGGLFNTCHGRMSYFLGHLLMGALLITAFWVHYAVYQGVSSEASTLTILVLTVVGIAFFIKSLALTLGRYRDMGIQSVFARFLALVALYIPLSSWIAALFLMFAPRDAFASKATSAVARVA